MNIDLEVLAKTEYQDLYRVTDGVLLVVNKFVPIEYENENVVLYTMIQNKENIIKNVNIG